MNRATTIGKTIPLNPPFYKGGGRRIFLLIRNQKTGENSVGLVIDFVNLLHRILYAPFK